MAPQLRVEPGRPELVHARHVWQLAVARVLSRLIWAAVPANGIYALRGTQTTELEAQQNFRSESQGWWRQIFAGSPPPDGGPGALGRISTSLAGMLAGATVSARIADQSTRWKSELERDVDFHPFRHR